MILPCWVGKSIRSCRPSPTFLVLLCLEPHPFPPDISSRASICLCNQIPNGPFFNFPALKSGMPVNAGNPPQPYGTRGHLPLRHHIPQPSLLTHAPPPSLLVTPAAQPWLKRRAESAQLSKFPSSKLLFLALSSGHSPAAADAPTPSCGNANHNIEKITVAHMGQKRLILPFSIQLVTIMRTAEASYLILTNRFRKLKNQGYECDIRKSQVAR